MAPLALVLELIFGAALALRSFVHWRRTGTTGFLPPANKAELAARGILGIAVLLVAAGTILALARLVNPIAEMNLLALQVAGVVLFLTGAFGTLIAQFEMGDSWRVGIDPSERTNLVTAGPFRVVRHPVFSASVLTGIGLALILPSPLMLAALVFQILGLELQVRRVEEPYLLAQHGDAYLSYASRTGRFFPGIGIMRSYLI